MHSSSPLRINRPARQVGRAVLCALALLLVQALGLAHRIAHSQHGGAEHVPHLSQLLSAHGEHEGCGDDDAHDHAHSHTGGLAQSLAKLFEGEGHQCRLLDAAAHADGLIEGDTGSSAQPSPPYECREYGNTPPKYHLAYAHPARAPPAATARAGAHA